MAALGLFWTKSVRADLFACFMDERTGLVPVEVALARIRVALNSIDPDRSRLAPEARLRVATAARSLTGRLDALTSQLLAEADVSHASERATGTPTSTWLAIDQNLTKREAAGRLASCAGCVVMPRSFRSCFAAIVSCWMWAGVSGWSPRRFARR